ncbi:MAG: HI1506-related protein [Pseudopelagicola sp.]|nr:HI1506-related protein [Pseudopelagicola sp.]
MSKVLIAATQAVGFFRCGVHFPEEGVVVDLANFTDTQITRLKSEPKLRITNPTEEQLAVANTDARKSAFTGDEKEAVAEVIRALSPEDFSKSGEPKVKAIEVLLEDTPISAALRDEVFAEMKEEGFEAPKASD